MIDVSASEDAVSAVGCHGLASENAIDVSKLTDAWTVAGAIVDGLERAGPLGDVLAGVMVQRVGVRPYEARIPLRNSDHTLAQCAGHSPEAGGPLVNPAGGGGNLLRTFPSVGKAAVVDRDRRSSSPVF